jgi:hypothetical protein
MMDDLISRQAAIDLLKQMRKDGDMVPWEGKNVFARIRKLPPAQPYTAEEIDKMQELESAQLEKAYELGRESVQPTGTWLIHKWGDDAQCSNCGKTFKDVYDMDNYDQHCRHCGTHMKGIRAI